ncbi:hypothetical protein NW754_006385 [Fusarium falciforme]|nr:hypothetical protein NW754_006385 [Fusarium falciforme]
MQMDGGEGETPPLRRRRDRCPQVAWHGCFWYLSRPILQRINRVKRPLNSVPQHQRCLTETLSSPNAIWTLTSIMLPKTPEADFKRDASNPLVEAIMNYELVHLEAYIVHVDMVLRNEVAYKLTKDTIETLVEYHKEVYCVDAKANTYDWSDKEQQCKKLHEDFVQAINKFVFRTHVSALEGLEEEGAGELLCGKSEEVKNNIFALMKPLLPPPPRVVDVVRQPTLLPSSPANNMWSQAGMHGSLPAVESWRVLPSSPSHPFPPSPLPSMLAPAQCGVSVSMGGMGGMGNMSGMGGMGGFSWDRYQEYATIM